jgi:hypothetical protein
VTQPKALRTLERNAFRDTLVDGLMELSFGMFLVILAGAMRLHVVPIAFAFAFGLGALVKRLKARFTYPRIGYVELRDEDPDEPRRGLAIPLALALGWLVFDVAVLAVAGDLHDPARWYRWMPLFFGVALMASLVAVGLRSGIPRFYLYAVLALLSGAVIPFLPVEGKVEWTAWLLLAVGVPVALCGAMVFMRFLHRSPVQRTETSDGALG